METIIRGITSMKGGGGPVFAWAEPDGFPQLDAEEGSSTVEYAIGAIAAAAFAGVLLVVVKSGAVKTALTDIIQQALTA